MDGVASKRPERIEKVEKLDEFERHERVGKHWLTGVRAYGGLSARRS